MNQLKHLQLILREVPRHLLTRRSWLYLAKEPVKCLRYIVAPILFAFSQRNKRGREALLETALNRVVDLVNPTKTAIPVHQWPLEADLSALQNLNSIQQLTDQLTRHRSDKHINGYVSVYQVIFAQILDKAHGEPPRVVEIGIGSNNPTVASNMGVFGTPGASLRAFRDFLSRAEIVGGDVDRTILFSEPGITTYFVNQLDPSSLRLFFTDAASFDLFIEDGLHELDANLNTLCVALEFAEAGAWIVIEDIDPDLERIWLAVAKCLENDHRCWVIRTHVAIPGHGDSLLFVAQRRAAKATQGHVNDATALHA